MYEFDCKTAPNTACTRPSEEHRDHGGGSRRVFRRFAWLEVGSVKVAFSRPTHQRVTPTVGRLEQDVMGEAGHRITA